MVVGKKKDDRDDNDKEKNHKGENDGNITTTKRSAPVCLWPPLKSKGIRHFLQHCKACPNDKKKAIMKVFHDKNALGGPAKYTRLQARKSDAATEKADKAVGRVAKLSEQSRSSFEATFINNN